MVSLKIKKVNLNEQGEVVVPRFSLRTPSTLPEDLPRQPLKDMRIIRVSAQGRTRTNRNNQGRNGHWLFDQPLCQNNQFGFIYLIVDNKNDRMYIGKKQFLGTGKENRGQETNWKWYTSSCKALQESIKANGKECFDFYILDEYKIRGTLGYAETWSLMFVEAPVHRDKWYNMLVNKVSWVVKEGISKKHKERIAAIINGNGKDLKVFVEDA